MPTNVINHSHQFVKPENPTRLTFTLLSGEEISVCDGSSPEILLRSLKSEGHLDDSGWPVGFEAYGVRLIYENELISLGTLIDGPSSRFEQLYNACHLGKVSLVKIPCPEAFDRIVRGNLAKPSIEDGSFASCLEALPCYLRSVSSRYLFECVTAFPYDRDLVMAAIRIEWRAFKYASIKLQSDEEIALLAFEGNEKSFHDFPVILKQKEDFVISLLRKSPVLIYAVAQTPLGSQPSFIKRAVREARLTSYLLPFDLSAFPDIMAEARRNERSMFHLHA